MGGIKFTLYKAHISFIGGMCSTLFCELYNVHVIIICEITCTGYLYKDTQPYTILNMIDYLIFCTNDVFFKVLQAVFQDWSFGIREHLVYYNLNNASNYRTANRFKFVKKHQKLSMDTSHFGFQLGLLRENSKQIA